MTVSYGGCGSKKTALQAQLALKQAEKEVGKDSSTKRPMDLQMAVLTEQEKRLVQEKQLMLEMDENRTKGSFELEFGHQVIDQNVEMLHRLRAEKVRIEIERLNVSPLIRVVKRAEIPK